VLAINYTVDPLLMTIIGGTGTFSGPVIGAAALHLSDRLLRTSLTIGPLTVNLTDSWNLILGLAFIAVVLLFPQGISGTWQRWRSRAKADDKTGLKWKQSPQNSQADV
jgi:branched-chain amino acid transport system permease protein